jgi:hypothetical protein
VENDTDDVLIVRREATAEASFAAIFERIRFGIAIAAMIKMIATTISNSISEKPVCFFRIKMLLGECVVDTQRRAGYPPTKCIPHANRKANARGDAKMSMAMILWWL